MHGIKKKDIQSKYDQTADHYDLRYEEIQKTKIEFLLYKLKQICEIKNFFNVLDVGCGTSIIYNILTDYLPKNFGYYGIDISINMIKNGMTKNLNTFIKNKNISMILGDAENLPFKKCKFDLIISLTVAQNIPNPKNYIDQMLKLLDIKIGFLLISFHKKIFSMDYILNLLKTWETIEFINIDIDSIEDYLFLIKYS
ncbi:MAG: class I SAM-dependent methyltransferase [Candidatus Helarchaeota archaeon]